MWLCINNLDQVIWLAENWKWMWYLNLFSMTRVNMVSVLLLAWLFSLLASKRCRQILGPDVQNFVSLTSSVKTNALTVVAKVFFKYIDIFAAKMWVDFAVQKLLTFFSKNINGFAIFQDRNFNVTLANNFVKFWATGPWSRKNYQDFLLKKSTRPGAKVNVL